MPTMCWLVLKNNNTKAIKVLIKAASIKMQLDIVQQLYFALAK
jgi:hypothetical protein